jgi:hypothetical protein
LKTSSRIEDGWAKDEYFYYAQNGAIHPIPVTGWGLGGLIWDRSIGCQANPGGSCPPDVNEVFFVGTEEQFHNAVPFEEGHPSNETATMKVHE